MEGIKSIVEGVIGKALPDGKDRKEKPKEKKREGWTKFPNTLFALKVSNDAKVVYTLIVHHCWGKNYCQKSQKFLAEKLQMSRKSLIKYLGELQKTRWLFIEKKGWGEANIYWRNPE